MKTVKIFLYDNISEPDSQKEKFGIEFESDPYMDYANNWDLIGVKIYGILRKVAIPGGDRDTILGHVNYVPIDKIDLIDKYYGKEFTKVKIMTMLDTECYMYIKRTDDIKKVI